MRRKQETKFDLGKSLCFQIPALLTGKVVVVISPLISLMHDQCLKLTKHGISACFLGSGQPDNTVEKKAMRGMYSIVYICPETVLRLIQPLQELAESHGIALFAIDEVHCVSKWGHDFRPAYSQLSALREYFTTGKLKSLQFDIPVMALTATATKRVRKDILKSLCMSKDTSVVLTSFFRPNLRFMVKHSRTSWASYESDFHELIKVYGGNKKAFTSDEADDVSICSDASDTDSVSSDNVDDNQDDYDESDISVMHSGDTGNHKKRRKLTIEFLENDVDVFQSADDLDVTCGEFCVQPPPKQCELSETVDPPTKPEKRLKMLKEPLAQGPTIIYVPTRKDTVRIANYLCKSGVKAAAYNAGLPKLHLRRTHKEFHENTLEVVVATIAFGMGIDKSNVRRIIHYGWPQVFFQIHLKGVAICDVCTNGPPQRQNLKEEACILLQTIGAHNARRYPVDSSYNDDIHFDSKDRRLGERPSLMTLVRNIREQFQKFLTTDILWWRGLSRILEAKGYIREGDDKTNVQIKYPELTELGLEFVKSMNEETFYVYPEADMLLESKIDKPFSSFSEWGKGWADPEIRRQRLERIQHDRSPTKRKSPRKQKKRRGKKAKPDLRTSRDQSWQKESA
ncbi:DNA helicase [Trifolium repens]|nr:DNA helicase [Trifolium repens]